MNQGAIQKVRRAVIEPMIRFYQIKALDDYQVQAFVEDLGSYSEESLDRAWKEVRRHCKSRPSIAHFMETLENEVKPGSGVSNPEARGDYWCQRNKALAEQAIRSPIGQSALAAGVGWDVWLSAYRDGKGDLTERDIHRAQQAQLDTANRLARMNPDDDQLTKKLFDHWYAMQAKEKELYATYYEHQPL